MKIPFASLHRDFWPLKDLLCLSPKGKYRGSLKLQSVEHQWMCNIQSKKKIFKQVWVLPGTWCTDFIRKIYLLLKFGPSVLFFLNLKSLSQWNMYFELVWREEGALFYLYFSTLWLSMRLIKSTLKCLLFDYFISPTWEDFYM